MDRNQVIGLLLIGAIFIGFNWFMRPSEAELAQQQKIADSIAKVEELDSIQLAEKENIRNVEITDTSINSDSIEEKDSVSLALDAKQQAKLELQYGIFAPASPYYHTDIKYNTIENDKLKLTLSSESGRIVKAELKEFKKYTHGDSVKKEDWPLVSFFDEDASKFSLSYTSQDGKTRSTEQLYFEPITSDFSISGTDSKSFVYRLKTNDENKYLEYIYTLKGDSYNLDFDVKFVGLDEEIKNSSVYFDWQANMLINEKSAKTERNTSTVFYKYDEDDRDYLSETGDDDEEFEQKIDWVAYKTGFFSTILLPNESFEAKGSKASIKKLESNRYLKDYNSSLNIGVDNPANETKKFEWYIGPNDYDILAAQGKDLKKIINLGWGIFGYINMYAIKPIFKVLNSTGMNIGLVILLLTFIVKLVIFPLYFKNYKSSAKMKVLRPEIQELGKKFPKKEDAMKKQQATMELYRKTGVNPMAGCIPMLIQMPILIAVFRFFPSAIELRQKSFLWADDLAGYDAIATWAGDIPFLSSIYGNHISLFTLLMAISTIFYTAMNSSNVPQQEGMPNMKVMMYIFPVMMIFFFNQYASGLSYYYLIANLMTMGQMLAVKAWFIDEDAIRAKIEENKVKPKKKSKFAERLEQLQKQQAAAGKRK